MSNRRPTTHSRPYTQDPTAPPLPTAHPLWPAFVAAVRANKLHKARAELV